MSRPPVSLKTLNPLNPIEIRGDFPILQRKIGGKPLIYLDNAATSQKPTQVLQAMENFYKQINANVHRGIHALSDEATAAYEGARKNVAQFINADSPYSIIFTSGATEGINLVASTYCESFLKPGDEILLSQMEHHSNLVPWIMLAKKKDLSLKYLPLNKDFRLDLTDIDKLITEKTKFVAITAMSNVLGTIPDLREIISRAHNVGAKVLIDGAQSVPHQPTDVKELDCDFLVFSGHKMLGPTGTGVLYAKRELLEAMPPYKGGGEMISIVKFDDVTFNKIPYKFEAGTPNIAGVVGLSAAIDYLTNIGMERIRDYDKEIAQYAISKLSDVPGLKIYGPLNSDERGSAISFTLDDIHPHDIGTSLDSQGIAIRAGHHCAMPLMKLLGLVATVRASFYFYNTFEEVDKLVEGLHNVRRFFIGR